MDERLGSVQARYGSSEEFGKLFQRFNILEFMEDTDYVSKIAINHFLSPIKFIISQISTSLVF